MEVSLAKREDEGSRTPYSTPVYHQRFERVQNRLQNPHTAYSRSILMESCPTHLLEGITVDSSRAFTPSRGLSPSTILSYRDVGYGHPGGAETYSLQSHSLAGSHGFFASFSPLVRHGSLASNASPTSCLDVDKNLTSKHTSVSYASTSRQSPVQSNIVMACHNSASSHTPTANNSPTRSHMSSDRHTNSQLTMSTPRHTRHSLTLDLSSPRHSSIAPLSHARYSPMTTLSHPQHSSMTTLNHIRHSPETNVRHIRHSPETTVRHIRQSPETTVRHIRQSPETNVRHIRHSPETTLNHTRQSPETTVNHIRHSPEATPSSIRSSPITTLSSTGHTPTTRILSSAPSHRPSSHIVDTRTIPESCSEGKPNPAATTLEEPQNLVRMNCKSSRSEFSTGSSRVCLQIPSSVKEEAPCISQVPPNVNEEAILTLEDLVEIRKLHECNSATSDISESVRDRMIKTEELSNLYSSFIQKRARFLVSTPLYKTLALRDRQKLLHTAVAMSSYFTGAHLIDTSDYTWKNSNGAAEECSHVMSVSSLRPVLSHDQFAYMMRFYMTYSPFFSDQTVTILMQVFSLFYPEPGLTEPRVVEEGRLHYIGLLSRYLISTKGPRVGQDHLKILIESQQEARQLMNVLQHVDLSPQVPRNNEVDSKKILMDGIQLVFEKARQSLSRVRREKQQARYHTDGSSFVPGRCDPQDEFTTTESPPLQDEDRINFIQRTLIRLADCEDPQILAEARRILPTDLILKFFQLQEGTPFDSKSQT